MMVIKPALMLQLEQDIYLYQGGVEPLVVQVPKGMDPDDWIRENGAEAILQSRRISHILD